MKIQSTLCGSHVKTSHINSQSYLFTKDHFETTLPPPQHSPLRYPQHSPPNLECIAINFLRPSLRTHNTTSNSRLIACNAILKTLLCLRKKHLNFEKTWINIFNNNVADTHITVQAFFFPPSSGLRYQRYSNWKWASLAARENGGGR